MLAARSDAWVAAVTAATRASWRLVVAVSGVVLLPATTISIISAASFGSGTVIPLVLSFVLFALSPFIHELAHAAAHVALADRERSIVVGVGRWGSGQIIRWTLPRTDDGLVAIAGPLAATASGFFVLALPLPYLIAYPIAALFMVHLLSLTRSAPDGHQLRTALQGAPDA
ncbi:hypothetical protein ACTHQN_06865 [Curtobacterium flaccumfaciens]|uniref:hypothetical protein n=1 Tax=Curtobacterium flaccumfaciens TaxID=2035 RepID=UPI003F7E03F9